MAKIPITLEINGERHEALAEPDRTLLDVLRSDLGLTGTKTNCLDAECGVCTVLVDGLAVNSCLYLAVVAQGRAITTIEGLAPAGSGLAPAGSGLATAGSGLAPAGTLHPLQRAFMEHGAVQCGYCIPGMILAAKAYLDDYPQPSESQVREALAGNLCRCTGYQKILDAVLAAAGRMAAGAVAS
jgi:carbon-monoxide dehydrogenase small subunit